MSGSPGNDNNGDLQVSNLMRMWFKVVNPGIFFSLLKGTENVRVLVDKLKFLFEEINPSCS